MQGRTGHLMLGMVPWYPCPFGEDIKGMCRPDTRDDAMLCWSRTFHFQVEFALISLGFSVSPRKKPGQMLSALFGFRRK